MYIHRIAVDANRINARGRIIAMNALETYHDANVVEIVQTSTLPAEFRRSPLYKSKSEKYRVIGGSSIVYFADDRMPDMMDGSSGTQDKWWEIYEIVFGPWNPRQGKPHKNSARDAMHIDQARQHAVDYFVTGDKKLLSARKDLLAANLGLEICTAEECLEAIVSYFRTNYGTEDSVELAKILGDGPLVVLGSNTCDEIQLQDPKHGEILLQIKIVDGKIAIGAILRDVRGEKLLSILPGQPVEFEPNGASVVMMEGSSHLLVGHETCESFAASHEGMAILQGRVARSGHIVISKGIFRDQDGEVVAEIRRAILALKGATLSVP